MIHEEICTYEVCKLAKEKGFPQHIGNDAYITENEYDDERYEVGSLWGIEFIPDYLPTITAPTQSLLQRWLREEKKIDIAIVPLFSGVYSYIVYNIHCRDNRVVNTNAGYATYELALEDALNTHLKIWYNVQLHR